MSTWQPIETAPKDGTEILAWDGIQRIVAWFDVFSERQQVLCGRPGDWRFSDDDPCLPTHWQPLPAPPDHSPSTTEATNG
jgi:hypothetical protein